MNVLNTTSRQCNNSFKLKKLTQEEINFNRIVSAWNTRDTQGFDYRRGNSNLYQNTKAMNIRIKNALKHGN